MQNIARILVLTMALAPAPSLLADDLSFCDPPPKATEAASPQYPIVESPRPAEGYVDVEFTITKEGEVKDVSVINSVVETGDAKFESGFARSALVTIQKWKYRAQLDACRAKVRFVFAFDDE